MADMQAALARGDDQIDPMSFKHNQLIKKAFTTAKEKAWASIQDHPEIIRLVKEARDLKIGNNEATRKSGESLQKKATKILELKNI
jgi:gamma-glutamylcysteine synthetase